MTRTNPVHSSILDSVRQNLRILEVGVKHEARGGEGCFLCRTRDALDSWNFAASVPVNGQPGSFIITAITDTIHDKAGER